MKKWYLAQIIFFSLFFSISGVHAKPQNTHWGLQQIRDSLSIVKKFEKTNKPDTRLSDLLVASNNKHQLIIYDTTKSTVIFRSKSSDTLITRPLVSSNKQFAYFINQDGWLSQFDLQQLSTTRRSRVGLKPLALALSADDRYLIIAKKHPPSFVILDSQTLKPLVFKTLNNNKGTTTHIRAIIGAPTRESFVAGIDQTNNGKTTRQIWEIIHKDNPLPVYNGPMHDYRMGEGIAKQPHEFPVRKIPVNDCTLHNNKDCINDWMVYSPTGFLIMHCAKHLNVWQLDARRQIAEMDLEILPKLSSAIIWNNKQNLILAIPAQDKAKISIINASQWKKIKTIKTKGIAKLITSQQNSDYLWLAIQQEHTNSVIQVMDKNTLNIIKTINFTSSNSPIAFIQFDNVGKQVFVGLENEKLMHFSASGVKKSE